MGVLRRKQTSADRKFVGRTEPPRDLEIVAAEGSRVRDARGRTFIDFQMGWCVGNLGWNPPEILARVKGFNGPSYVAPQDTYAPWTELARRLIERAPGKLARAYRCVGGSEAVECALQIAMTHTGRHKLVSLEGAYHGNTFGARSVGEVDLDAHLAGMKKLSPPLDAKALDKLETHLKHRDVAALIMEPIVMALNVLVPDDDFMREVVPLCHRYGTLVIADEVASGFGRTGKFFASEHFDFEPDLMCLAKAMGSGVMPIGSTLATKELADSVEGELHFYSTNGWMPLATEAALGTLDVWDDRGDEILANIGERASQLCTGLAEIFDDTEIRVHGAAIAIDIGDEDAVKKITKRCKDRGLIVIDEEDTILLMPACTLDDKTAADALSILEKAS